MTSEGKTGSPKAALLCRYGWITSVAVVLGVGLACTYWVATREQAQNKARLAAETRLVANAVNASYVQDLRGSQDDLKRPSYQRLKEQLTLVRSATPTYRFLYVVGRRADGTVYFFADSEPPDSSDYSPPGQTYEEASPQMQSVFSSGVTCTEGPFADRWGTWVSGLSPIVDPASGRVIAVLGADVDASDWFREVAMECIPPAATALAVAALLTLLFAKQKLTWSRKAQDLMRVSEARFSTIWKANPAAIALTRISDGRLADVNPAWEELTGVSRAEAVGHHPEELGLWVRPEQRRNMIEAIRARGKDSGEMQLRCRDGQVGDVLMSAELVEVAGEGFMLTLAQDITDRKLAEEVIAEANRNLEKANRELKEMQAQVVQSEKLASIGQLAAGVAHEMNTPVGFVASNFQTLQKYMDKLLALLHHYESLGEAVEDGLKEKRLEILDHIKQARKELKIDFLLQDIGTLFAESNEGLSRVTKVIQNLKDFSRVDQAQAFAEYDLNEGIEATLTVARNEIKYDADVKKELSPLPEIACNSGQINQVLLNILVNAVQAIKSQKRDDRGTITVRTSATPAEVICEISDDGPGIPAEIRNKIFDPFFTTKPVGQGTGLGLSVSYDIIVTKHHGKILVDSTVGKGTTFTIKLPLAAQPAAGDRACKLGPGKDN